MTAARYSTAAIALHWLIALALAFQLSLGWRLEEMPKGVGQFAAFQLHKSVGITILLLSLARLALRVWGPKPARLPDSPLNHMLATLVHWSFYLVMIGGPLTGWILVSTAKVKVPTLLFGIIPWPHLPVSAAMHGVSEALHGLLAFLGVALFVLHIAGALRHQFMKGEPLLARMMPGVVGKGFVALGLALSAIIGAMALAKIMPFKASAPVEAIDQGLSRATVTDAVAASVAGDTMTVAENAAEEVADNAVNAVADEEEAKPATMPLSAWAVQPGGKLGFSASWTGNAVPGRFERWSGDISFSPDDLKASRIRVTVDLASVSTGEAQYDDSLKGSDFFNVAAHPQAVFTSSAITHAGGDRYRAAGTLSLHGVSKPQTLDFTLRIADDLAKVSGSTRLDRTAFGVGAGEWAATDQIAGAVAVNFTFQARRKP